MADIALLVAEEFEARRRHAKEDGIEAINRMVWGYAAALGEKAEKGVESLMRREIEVTARRAARPKTPVASAASDGFFSA